MIRMTFVVCLTGVCDAAHKEYAGQFLVRTFQVSRMDPKSIRGVGHGEWKPTKGAVEIEGRPEPASGDRLAVGLLPTQTRRAPANSHSEYLGTMLGVMEC